MKRVKRIVALVVVMTMLFAVPVLADEDRSGTMISSENTDDLVRQLDAYNLKVMGQVLYVGGYNSYALPNGTHAVLVSKQVKDYDIRCCDNHMFYLKTVLSNAQQDLANKQAQYNSAVAQMAVSPSYAQLVPTCQAQVAAAQQAVVDAQNRIAAAQAKLAKYYAANVY